MITPSKTSRRPLKFKTVTELDAELDRLRPGKYTRAGKWSLPQVCHHLASVIEGSLQPAPNDEPTPEEAAIKAKFFGMVQSPQGMPENMPIGNAALIPGDNCTEAEIDRLRGAFQTLGELPHKQVKVGRCGPVPVAELIDLHLIHAAHHLSFLVPLTRRDLHYTSIDELLADVKQLRQGYIQLGQWSLPQMCRHLTVSITSISKPTTAPLTPEQAKFRPFLNDVLSTGKIPAGLQAPDASRPPEDCSDADIDAFLAAFDKARDYREPMSGHPRFGPLNLQEFHRMILVHAAHHLSYLIPTTSI
jgi:hypothetical protein